MFSKFKLFTINFVLFAFLISFCFAQDEGDYGKLFKSYYKNGQLKSGKLKKPKVVQDYPCKGKVSFKENGYIHEFTLSKDHKINGVIIPAESRIEIQIDQKLIYLSKDTEIKGLLIQQTTGKDDFLLITDKGKLQEFTPKNNVEIENVPCKGSNKIYLYPDGKLWACTLSADHEINGKTYTEGTSILIDEKGNAEIFTEALLLKMRRRLAN